LKYTDPGPGGHLITDPAGFGSGTLQQAQKRQEALYKEQRKFASLVSFLAGVRKKSSWDQKERYLGHENKERNTAK
jgi:hypothetical protein